MEDKISYAKREVLQACRLLVERGLVARTWGNVSARAGEGTFVITPSGLAYDSLTEECIVTVRLADGSYEGDLKPSSEWGIHADSYLLRPEVQFVVHTHQRMASALCVSSAAPEIPEDLENALRGKIVPTAAYGMPSTKKLRQAVRGAVEAYRDCNAFLMRRHGALLLGRDLQETFAAAEALEEMAERIYQRCVGDDAGEKSREPVKARLYREPKMEELCDEIRKSCGIPWVIAAEQDAVIAYSGQGQSLKPWLDDLAQIAGPNIACCDLTDIKTIASALRRRNAVLIKGKGALCTGRTRGDAEAVKAILEKGCMAAFYAGTVKDAHPLGAVDAALQRYVYLHKYSKKQESFQNPQK